MIEPTYERHHVSYLAKDIELCRVEGNRYLAVFVHGLGGNASNYWGGLKTLLCSDPDLVGIDFAFWGYRTPGIQQLLRRALLLPVRLATRLLVPRYSARLMTAIQGHDPSLREIGSMLRTHLTSLFQSYEHIVLFGHSLGGLIVQACVVGDSHVGQPPAYHGAAQRITAIALCATPTAGCELADLVSEFKLLVGKSVQIEALSRRSEDRGELQRQFIDLIYRPRRMPLTLWCAQNDQIVTRQEVEGVFGAQLARPLTGTHSTCIRDEDCLKVNYVEIHNWLLAHPSIVKYLGRRLESETNPAIRAWLAWSLGKIAGDEAEDILRRRLASEQNPFARLAVEQALEPFEKDDSRVVDQRERRPLRERGPVTGERSVVPEKECRSDD